MRTRREVRPSVNVGGLEGIEVATPPPQIARGRATRELAGKFLHNQMVKQSRVCTLSWYLDCREAR